MSSLPHVVGAAAAAEPSARRHHERTDPHRKSSWLVDVVLGGQDGLVNVLGVLLGVAAATRDSRTVLVAGLAAAFAESVSMGAVAYTSNAARGELYRSERAREYRHIQAVPDLERAEVRSIYEKKGFRGELLDRVVDTITRSRDVWVAVMMAEEHGLQNVDRKGSLRAAAVVGIAALIGSILPLLPFLFMRPLPGAFAAVILGAVVLFAFGYYKATVTVGRPVRAGLVLMGIGTASALVGYVIGASAALFS